MDFFTDADGFTYCSKKDDLYYKYKTKPQHATLIQKSNLVQTCCVVVPSTDKTCTVCIRKDENNQYYNFTDDIVVCRRQEDEVWSYTTSIQTYVFFGTCGNILIPISITASSHVQDNVIVMDVACMRKVMIQHQESVPGDHVECHIKYSTDGPLDVKTIRLKARRGIHYDVDMGEEYMRTSFPSTGEIERKFVKRMQVIC